MYYIIGDIHGYLDKLLSLMKVLKSNFQDDDTFVFLGDYIDRGYHSYEVIEFLISLSKKANTVFLTGNHEVMLKNYLAGDDFHGMFLHNGGRATIESYKRNIKKFRLPYTHEIFLNNLDNYFEGEDFIAVHAGLNPSVEKIEDQNKQDMIWIREAFFNSSRRWEKTIIFGHTPTTIIHGSEPVYFNDLKNIIGVDSGVIFGRKLSCLRWPDKKIFISAH